MSNHPISMNLYNKFLLLSDISTVFLTDKLNSYSEVYFEKKELHSFSYISMATTPNGTSQTLLVHCPQNISFFHFHNLILWFSKTSCQGIMINTQNSDESYYCFPDYSNPCGDCLAGYFSNNSVFSIFIPEAYTEHGNMQVGQIQSDIISLNTLITTYDTNYFSSFDLLKPEKIDIYL